MPRTSLLLLCAFCILHSAFCIPHSAAQPLIHPGDKVAIIGNTFADQLKREGYFETLLLARVVDDEGRPAISLRNLGWGGDTVSRRDRPTNFPAEDATLAAFGADVLILSFGLSESFQGEKGLPAFRADYERLVDHYLSQKYNGESPPRLVLVSPIAFEDLGESTPRAAQRNHDLAAYTKAIGQLAASKNLGFVDLHTPTLAFHESGDVPPLTVNGVHLGAAGYWQVARILADALVPATPDWRLEIDMETGAARGRNLSVTGAAPVSGGLAFTVKEPGYPAPPPPHAGVPPKDLLVVRNLPDATYTLTIDGIVVATATAGEWERGVSLGNSPTHRDVEAYRAAVIDKNEQFTFSWKALNQVHIVGERKKSNSGRALPAEVEEFNELANEKDALLRTLEPNERTRKWRLVATPEK